MILRIRFVVAVLCVLVTTSWTAGAQVTTGTIVGAVRDANGVVPGAAVTIREVNKGTADNFGGWQFAGISPFTTGRPFTVFMQTGVNNGAPSWPNRIGSGRLDDPTVDLWYNPRDFVAPPANTYGDSGRGILYGPGHVNFDTSLSKRVTVVGRANVEFRWDAFNLFNHPGFGFPNQNFDSPTAGRITSTAVDNRSMQFSLKLNF